MSDVRCPMSDVSYAQAEPFAIAGWLSAVDIGHRTSDIGHHVDIGHA